MRLGRTSTLALALVAPLAALGCGASKQEEGRSSADRAYVSSTVQHHAQTTRLLTLPQTLRLPAETIDLADRLRGERIDEIAELSTLLRTWGDRVPHTGLAHEDEGHETTYDESIDGIVGRSSLDRLAHTRGPAFARLWVEVLLRHERGALDAARAEVGQGRDSRAIALAREDVARHAATVRELSRLRSAA
jgi:uncharacterized protein (DUF305 family)